MGGGVVGLCTGVEIRSCGNEGGGFAAGGRVLGLGERTGGCSAAHCGLLVENAMVGGRNPVSPLSLQPSGSNLVLLQPPCVQPQSLRTGLQRLTGEISPIISGSGKQRRKFRPLPLIEPGLAFDAHMCGYRNMAQRRKPHTPPFPSSSVRN